ncbi:MAG: acyltransferase family protein [Mizugakiibacter sp.]|uniref:acyltransferase family protein n=1 Tax=Mizugakiibacter sp. TaxID=1972610 RepID=UPI0031C3F030|nr:acyltransferase family protein [Xanthomonadaceae bacterium]
MRHDDLTVREGFAIAAARTDAEAGGGPTSTHRDGGGAADPVATPSASPIATAPRAGDGKAPATAPPRRYDLDWLRVLVVLALLLFHSGMPFVAEWDWHIKNAETSSLFTEWMYFLSRWRMALLFLISGVGTWFALGSRGGTGYLRERATRLLLPLLFGMLVVVPPQIYMERLTQGVPYANYLQFWPSIFDLVPYPQGNTSWHHLWFVAYLFCYSALLLPLFLWLRGERGARALARLRAGLHGWRLLLLAAPLAAAHALYLWFPETHDLAHDPATFAYYLAFFAYGFLLGRDEGVWSAIERYRWHALRLAFFALVALDYLRWNKLEPGDGNLLGMLGESSLSALNAWCWVLAVLGFGKRWLNRDNALRRYATEAVYPFYILHQTVIVVIAYYVVQVPDESILGKWLFLVAASFAATMGLYEFAVRPYRLVRPLFGLKPHGGTFGHGNAA